MTIKNYTQGVRRIHSGFDLICEVEIDGEYREFARFDEMGDDFAYTNSDAACRAKVREREAGLVTAAPA